MVPKGRAGNIFVHGTNWIGQVTEANQEGPAKGKKCENLPPPSLDVSSHPSSSHSAESW